MADNGSVHNRHSKISGSEVKDLIENETMNARWPKSTRIRMMFLDGSSMMDGALTALEHHLFSVELDPVFWILTILSISTRLWMLDKPNAVVFDEVQQGGFAGLYVNRTFFFDIHPPLGKMLIAAGGWLGGYDGNWTYDHVGAELPPTFPVFYLRLIPAVLGSLVVPAAYQIMLGLGFNRWTCTLASYLVVFDNAMLTQSRYMLIEGSLILFLSLALLTMIHFIKASESNRVRYASVWICCCGVMLSLAICTRYVAVFTILLVIYHVARHYWSHTLLLANLTDLDCVKQFLQLIFFLLLLPLLLYSSVFYLHFSLLPMAGPHDDMMTSSFQASLQGGLSEITRGQPSVIAYGSQVTLRHTHGHLCWLHSHRHIYPLQYPNGRSSSAQQQVSCYSYKDINNWWIIKDPTSSSLIVDDPIRPVHNGDIIQLIHGMTGRALNSHDVAGPMSVQHQEVSCYIDYNISMPAQNLWQLKILNADSEGSAWKAIQSQVLLIHVNTSRALKTSGMVMGEWGFHQLEVVADVLHNQPTAVWNVEEHKYSRLDESEDEGNMDSDLEVDVDHKPLGFWSKFFELQWKMLTSKIGVNLVHTYSSTPRKWPFMERNIAYWVDEWTNAQIHFLGNPVVWFSATLSVLLYAALLVFYLLRRRRTCFDLPDVAWCSFCDVGRLLFTGYLLHYLPFFLTERTLFIYQYLPAYFFKILLLAAVVNHLHQLVSIFAPVARYPFIAIVLFWLIIIYRSFSTYSIISYGDRPMTAQIINKLRLLESWYFIPQRT